MWRRRTTASADRKLSLIVFDNCKYLAMIRRLQHRWSSSSRDGTRSCWQVPTCLVLVVRWVSVTFRQGALWDDNWMKCKYLGLQNQRMPVVQIPMGTGFSDGTKLASTRSRKRVLRSGYPRVRISQMVEMQRPACMAEQRSAPPLPAASFMSHDVNNVIDL